MNAQKKIAQPVRTSFTGVLTVGLVIAVAIGALALSTMVRTQDTDYRAAARDMWADLNSEVGSELPLTWPYPAVFRLEEIVRLDSGDSRARGTLVVLLPKDARNWSIITEEIASCSFTVQYFTGRTLREITSTSCGTLTRATELGYQLGVKLTTPIVITIEVPFEVGGLEVRTVQ